MASYKLLSVSADAKTPKGEKLGYLTGVLYLAPANLSGYEVCPQRSKGCTQACLNTAGRGGFNSTQAARVRKTRRYFQDRAAFMLDLFRDISKLVQEASRKGLKPTIRLNGTSDIPWERVPLVIGGFMHKSILHVFPSVLFYDYTKVTKRALAFAKGEMPRNYHLTFSLTEDNDDDARRVLQHGGNVAAVFNIKRGAALPPGAVWQEDKLSARWGDYSHPILDGDETDARFLDKRGSIIGLRAKGKARHDATGFVRAA